MKYSLLKSLKSYMDCGNKKLIPNKIPKLKNIVT